LKPTKTVHGQQSQVARIDGWAVGIVANESCKTKKGEMQFGGVIYSDSADKAIIAIANQKKIL
jgi:acetyl-CoA carboxylase carboxyltransferase component